VPAGEERKIVTVLFADVIGSTGLAERLDPERLREVMDAFFSAMREEIEAVGGTVEKFIGDAVMAAFGVPVAHEDDPARALRAALGMQRRLELVNEDLEARFGLTLQMRIGVNTGAVLASTTPKPGEAMVTGDAVNTAARLQTAADPGTALVAERTAAAVRGFVFERVEPLELKGKPRPVGAFRLVDEAVTPGQERGVPGLVAPIVGRDRELDLLRSLYARVEEERRPHLVTIYGDAGVGKSRLLREFVAWTEERDLPPVVLSGRCLPYGDGITYWPMAEILKGCAGILDSDAPELAVEKVRKTGAELLTDMTAADPRRATAALAYTVGLEDPDVSFAQASPQEVRDEVHAAWRSFFSALAIERPVMVVIEDIHWADPVLLDLLEELADRVDGPALFACPSRPDLTARHPTWGGGRRNHSSIALDPLSSADAEHLIELLLSVDELPPSVHARILERAEGNPFYLEEIIRKLIDEGSLLRRDDRWRADPSIGEVVIPDTVQSVLASRIDLLEPNDKRVLQAAAVVGRVFWPGPVADLTGVGDDDLVRAFRRLEDRELVLSRPGSTLAGQPEFLFKHILTRDVAYESLLRKERGQAHRVVASWLERVSGDRVGEFSELLAYHLSTAVSCEREVGQVPDPELRVSALRWLLRASHDARRRLVLRKAERLGEEALTLAESAIDRTDALEAIAEATFEDYTGDLAWRYFREAARVRSAAEPPDGRRVAYLAARACEVRQRWPGSMRGELPDEADVKEVLDLGFASLPPGDSEERVRLLGIQAGWPFAFPDEGATMKELEAFEAAGLEAADIALRLGKPNLASGSLDQANAPWSSLGWYGRVVPLWERRAELVPQLTDMLEIGDAFSTGAWSHFEIGNYRRSLDIADEGLRIVSGRGPNVELHLRAWRIAALHRLGEWQLAVDEFPILLDLLGERRADPPYFVAHAFAMVGIIHEVRGDRMQSDRLTATLLPLASGYMGRLYAFLVRLLVERGDLVEARSLTRPANWRVHAGDAYEGEGELLAALGEWADVPAFVEEARGHAARAPALALDAFADRLEGRAALAAGDVNLALERLDAASAAFSRLSVPWERAITDLLLAQALESVGRTDVARLRATAALEVLDRLQAHRGASSARALLDGLGPDPG
jgi:class 3 adenylate cyclase/tetratricopeptide (TPR) repeat protein